MAAPHAPQYTLKPPWRRLIDASSAATAPDEEYARAEGPGRLGHIGETLLGPTIIAFGSEQVEPFLRQLIEHDHFRHGHSQRN